MFIRVFAKDDSRQGQLDISAILAQGFRPRFINGAGQFHAEGDNRLSRIIRRGLAHEETLTEAEELSLIEILKLIAGGALQPPDELAAGSTDFHVTEALITQARDAIAASEAP